MCSLTHKNILWVMNKHSSGFNHKYIIADHLLEKVP